MPEKKNSENWSFTRKPKRKRYFDLTVNAKYAVKTKEHTHVRKRKEMERNDWKMSRKANKTPFEVCSGRCVGDIRKLRKKDGSRAWSEATRTMRKWDLHYSVYTIVHSLANRLTSIRHTHSTPSIPLNYLHFARLVFFQFNCGCVAFAWHLFYEFTIDCQRLCRNSFRK